MRLGFAGIVLTAFLLGCGQVSHAPPQPSNQPAQSQIAGLAEGYGRATGEERAVSADAPAPAPASVASPATPDVEANASDARAGEQQQAPGANPRPPGADPVMLLAYAFQTTLELPADRVANVMDAHVKACQDAGPRLCQLVGSSREGDPESAVSGQVDIRAEPHWLHGFMNALGPQASAAGGRIVSQTTTTEDLTRSIVDTEANLRAQKTLRDRLQTLLASRPGRLSDLLDVERELARVQGEIDSTQSNLAVMRTRVDMSALTLSYQSSARPLRSDTFRPLGDAFASFLGIVVQGFAWIVTLIAVAIPFAIVIGPIVWLILRWRARRKARKAAAAA